MVILTFTSPQGLQQLPTLLSLLLPSLKDKPCPGPYSGLIGMKIYVPEAGTSQHLKEEGREGCLERGPEAEGAGNSLGEGRKGSEANPPPSLQRWGRVSHPAKQGTWMLRAAYQVSWEPMSLAVSAYYPTHPSAPLPALPAPSPACAN